MASSLIGLETGAIAGGVETEEQLDFVRKHACTIVQGFYFGRPMPSIICGSISNLFLEPDSEEYMRLTKIG